MEVNRLRIKLLDPECLPFKKHFTDAGYDLKARDSCVICPGDTIPIPSGVCFEIPPGWEGDIRPRSSSSLKGLHIAGTVDSDYRGEIKIIVNNSGNDAQYIQRGERIAQMVITPCLLAELEIVDELDETERGDQGFGSTGRM